jgi:methylated-DNA-protein-cysteine methyltransferase-like protein
MNFTSPPNLKAYYAIVWEIVKKIPLGKVASYGQIARMIPPPFGMNFKDYMAWSPRWVGGAMANCPEDVPWQRVINSQGKISQRRGGTFNQRVILEEEGIIFDDHDRVDLNRYGWEGITES